MRTRIIPWMIAVAYFFLSLAAFGQRVTGAIDGRVTDPSGAILPGVEVTVTNESTGQTRTAMTNETGFYNVPLLPSGTYSVQASLPGFRTELRRGIVVEVDRNARVEIQLQVGAITEKVEVVADAPLVQIDTSALGQVIDAQRVAQLPLNGRDFLQLASLTPGVQPNSEGSNLSTQSGSVNVNGAREVFNNFMLDGIDNNDSGPAQLVIVPSVDSIQEFKVQTSNYSAEYGRSAGGLINVSTKSGSNSFHGSVYEFLRNSAMDARNFFDNPAQPKLAFKRNQFGATLGGPIAQTKTFFFGAYERTVIRQPQSATARVPPAPWRNGDFSSQNAPLIDPLTGVAFPGNIIPQNRILPIGRAMLGLFPSPNASGVNNLISVSKLTVDQDNLTGRLDHTFSDKDSMFIRYSYWNQPRLEPYARSSTTIGGYGVFLLTRTQSLVLSETRVFNPNLVNELRVGYARLKGGLFAESRNRPEVKSLALPGTRVFDQPNMRADFLEVPQVVLAGFNTVAYTGPQIRFDNMYDYIDNVSYTRGAHKIKVGFEGRRSHNNFHDASTPNGRYQFDNRYTGNAVADLLLGYPSQTMRQVGDMDTYGRTWYLSGFLQDDWRIGNNLTLNLGLRYEYQTNGYTINDRKVTFDTKAGVIKLVGKGDPPADVVPILNQYPGVAIKDGTVPRGGWLDDRNNFAPRLGFAYDISGDGKTVIRGGGGIFYVNVAQNKTYQATRAFPFYRINNVFASTDPRNPNLLLSNPFPAELLSTGIAGRSVDMHMRTGYMIQQNLNVQRQLDQATVLEIGYAGSKGNHLNRSRDLNAAPRGAGSIASRSVARNAAMVAQQQADCLHLHVARQYLGPMGQRCQGGRIPPHHG